MMEDINSEEEFKAKLLLLPKDCKGILFVEENNLYKATVVSPNLGQFIKDNNIRIEIALVRDLDGVRFLPFS